MGSLQLLPTCPALRGHTHIVRFCTMTLKAATGWLCNLVDCALQMAASLHQSGGGEKMCVGVGGGGGVTKRGLWESVLGSMGVSRTDFDFGGGQMMLVTGTRWRCRPPALIAHCIRVFYLMLVAEVTMSQEPSQPEIHKWKWCTVSFRIRAQYIRCFCDGRV